MTSLQLPAKQTPIPSLQTYDWQVKISQNTGIGIVALRHYTNLIIIIIFIIIKRLILLW